MTELNNNMTFEEAFAALRETVTAIENPKTPLRDVMALYERACRLTIYCRRKIRDVKMEITDIHSRMTELKNSDEPLF